MQSHPPSTNYGKRSSSEHARTARQSLIVAGLCALAATLPALLYALILFLINNHIGDWGNGNADILLLILLGGGLWTAACVNIGVVMLIRAGIEFYSSKREARRERASG